MKITHSSMSKLTETYLLLKTNLKTIRAQAERLHRTFRQISDEFKLTDSKILEIGTGTRMALLQMFDETNTVIGIDKFMGAFYQGYPDPGSGEPGPVFLSQADALLFFLDPLHIPLHVHPQHQGHPEIRAYRRAHRRDHVCPVSVRVHPPPGGCCQV